MVVICIVFEIFFTRLRTYFVWKITLIIVWREAKRKMGITNLALNQAAATYLFSGAQNNNLTTFYLQYNVDLSTIIIKG